MTTVAESVTANPPIAATLVAGVQQVSNYQTVSFQQYSRWISPLDGSVYWIAAAAPFQSQGSIHYAESRQQREDESVTINHVLFTSLTEVNDLNLADGKTLFVGTFNGQRFAFSNRANYYQQANLYHYRGDAVYPALATQLVNSLSELNQTLTVSNSLPIWLALVSQYTKNTTTPLSAYPSFLLDANIEPPYIAVHIGSTDTRALQSVAQQAPVFEQLHYVNPTPGYWPCGYVVDEQVSPFVLTGSEHLQLMADKVRLTTYGLQNDAIMSFCDYLTNYLGDDCNGIGLMSAIAVRDDKRTQTELNTIAQKKIIEVEVSYQQNSASACAASLILSAVPTFILGA